LLRKALSSMPKSRSGGDQDVDAAGGDELFRLVLADLGLSSIVAQPVPLEQRRCQPTRLRLRVHPLWRVTTLVMHGSRNQDRIAVVKRLDEFSLL
jgi:hypothetical protein